jgi:PAS domain S-box-containing protein
VTPPGGDRSAPDQHGVDAHALLVALGAAAAEERFDDALDRVVVAVAATGWDLVLAWTLDDAHRRLRLHGSGAGDLEGTGALARASAVLDQEGGRGLVGKAWSTMALVQAGDRAGAGWDDAERTALAASLGLSDAVAIPLADGPLLGAVVEAYARPVDGATRRARIEALRAAAALVGPALVSLRVRSAAAITDARFHALVDTAVDAIVQADHTGAIVGWNAAATAMFGFEETEVLGRPLTVLMPDRFRDAHREGLARVVGGAPPRLLGQVVEVMAQRRDGTEFPVELALSSWPGQDTPCFAGIIRDVTERHAAAAAMWAAREQAEQANAAKTEFLSRVSHELRTPLNAILGFAQLLALEPVEPDHDDAVQQVLRSGRHLLALVDDVLDLGLIESGRAALSIGPVDLAEAVGAAIRTVAPLAAERGTAVTRAEALPEVRVRADGPRLTQVVTHVLAHAVRAGGTQGPVTVRWDVVGTDARVAVAGAGAWVGPGAAALAFEPFERAGVADGDGTGLDLALVDRLVHAMAGRVGVDRPGGTGTTLWFEVPCWSDIGSDIGSARAPRDRRDDPGAQTPAGGARPAARVLYVEDNPANVKLVERILRRAPDVDVDFVAVVEGGPALDVAVAWQPHLVLLDLNLPDMPGDEVLAALAAHPATAAIPVVIVSADAYQGRIDQLHALGASDYITKPFDVATFLAKVGVYLPT